MRLVSVLLAVLMLGLIGCARQGKNATTMPAFVAAPIPDTKAAFMRTAGSLRIASVDGQVVARPQRMVKVYPGDHDFRFDARGGAGEWAVRFRVSQGHAYRAKESGWLFWRSLEIRDEQTRVVATIR